MGTNEYAAGDVWVNARYNVFSFKFSSVIAFQCSVLLNDLESIALKLVDESAKPYAIIEAR